ncbi:MAG TPA: hypothetical protein GX008_03565 [Firmicutes bacterium]|nr:hypothetical protein [Bacillota bacterium]
MSKTSYLSLVVLVALLGASLSLTPVVRGENTVEVTGTVLCAESDIPLHGGTITVGEQRAPISQGQFQLRLAPGRYSITVTGPYRQPKTFALNVDRGTRPLGIMLDPQFSQEEVHLLAQITRAEAEGESHKGQVAVAATILNRTASPRYPQDIPGVVYQKLSGRYQYSPVADGRINLPPTPQSFAAAYEALAGVDPTNGATGFFNPAKTRDKWVWSQKVTAVIGNHRFFRY